MNNPTARKNNREEEQSRSRIESTIPPPVSTRTDSPIQQGFAVQDKELPETSIGTFPGRERERVAAQKLNPIHMEKGPFIGKREGGQRGEGRWKAKGLPPLMRRPHQGEGRSPMMASHLSLTCPLKDHSLTCHVDYPPICHVGNMWHFTCIHVTLMWLPPSWINPIVQSTKYVTFPFSSSEAISNIPEHFR